MEEMLSNLEEDIKTETLQRTERITLKQRSRESCRNVGGGIRELQRIKAKEMSRESCRSVGGGIRELQRIKAKE